MDIWDDLQFVIAVFSVVLIREWCIKVCFSIVLVFSVYSSDSHFYINFFVNKIKVKQNKTKIYLETSIENERERDTFEIYSVPPFLLFFSVYSIRRTSERVQEHVNKYSIISSKLTKLSYKNRHVILA